MIACQPTFIRCFCSKAALEQGLVQFHMPHSCAPCVMQVSYLLAAASLQFLYVAHGHACFHLRCPALPCPEWPCLALPCPIHRLVTTPYCVIPEQMLADLSQRLVMALHSADNTNNNSNNNNNNKINSNNHSPCQLMMSSVHAGQVDP